MGSSWWTIEVYGCVRPYHSEGFLQFLVDLRGARMCQTRACEELSISERILVSSFRIPKVSLMSGVLKCDQYDQKVSINGAVTHAKCLQERSPKVNNQSSYHANSHHAHLFGPIIKDMPGDQYIFENIDNYAPPLYEELSLPSGMETLDIRVGLSKIRMEREKEQFHQREVINHESDDAACNKPDKVENNGENETLDVRMEHLDFSENSVHSEKTSTDESSLGKSNKVFSNYEDPWENNKPNDGEVSNKKYRWEYRRGKRHKEKSITKLIFEKLDRLTQILLCKT